MSDDPKKKPEEVKDLTNLMIHSKALEDSGHAPVAPEGSVMDEVPIEKIDDFESLEDYAVTNPPPELPADPSPDPAQNPSHDSSSDLSSAPAADSPDLGSGQESNLAPGLASESLGGSPDAGGATEAPSEASTSDPFSETSGHAAAESAALPSSDDFASPSSPSAASELSPSPAGSSDASSDSQSFPTGGSTEFPTSPEGSAGSDAFTMGESSGSHPEAEPGGDFPPSSASTPGEFLESSPSADPASPVSTPPHTASASEQPSSSGAASSEELQPAMAVSAPTESPASFEAPSAPVSDLAVPPPSPAPPQAAPAQPTLARSLDPIAPAKTDTPVRKPHGPATSPLEQIREFADKEAPAKPNVPAAFPFSLSITGDLLPEEKEKLLDLITRENMGIREIDLEPQFQSGRVLVPRISEFAAILLVQALRGTRAKIKVGPSDQIFATAETRDETSATSGHQNVSVKYISDLEHPAEHLPVTTENHLPNQLCHLIDIVSASASLKSNSIEAETTTEYQEIVEALQREIKYKAFRKGATAIINFKIQLNLITSPTHYRVTVLGTAVGKANPRPDPQPSV